MVSFHCWLRVPDVTDLVDASCPFGVRGHGRSLEIVAGAASNQNRRTLPVDLTLMVVHERRRCLARTVGGTHFNVLPQQHTGRTLF